MTPKIVTAPKITGACERAQSHHAHIHAGTRLTKLKVSAVTGKKNGEIMTCVYSTFSERATGERDETHGKYNGIEERRARVEWAGERAEAKVRALEVVRGLREPEQRDEAVRGDGGHAAGADEACERHLAWEDRAQERGGEDEDDGHGVARLAVRRDLADPAGEGEDAVARDGEDQPRGGNDGDARVLRRG
jgi:hypothetical protein